MGETLNNAEAIANAARTKLENIVKDGYNSFADKMMNDQEFQSHTLMTVVAMLINHVQALEKRIEALEAKPQTDEEER